MEKQSNIQSSDKEEINLLVSEVQSEEFSLQLPIKKLNCKNIEDIICEKTSEK